MKFSGKLFDCKHDNKPYSGKKTLEYIVFFLWIAAAVVCAAYGLTIKAAGSGTGFFAVWICMSVIFLLFAFAVKSGLWRKLSGIIRKIFITVACFGMAFFLIVEGCIVSGFDENGEDGLDYIIVLGAQVYESGPSPVLKYRLNRAAEYLKDNPDTKCIVSGGQGYNEPFAEAEGMALYLKEKGISSTRIICETESQTTAENISNSMKLMEAGASAGVVTNDFHVYRAVKTAEKQGLESVSGIAAGSPPLYLPNNMFREFFGLMKFWILP